MPETAPKMNAADLIVHGTFELRCALDQRAHRARQLALPASRLETLEVFYEAKPPRERPRRSVGDSVAPLGRRTTRGASC